jgi:asparagine synthase (glutamine-hydrolysing)
MEEERMCGIAGLISSRAVDPRLVRSMADSLAHRGPDDRGVWVDEEARVGLGHRRLSIIDLSPSGHQPMFSADGRWVIIYNGEIYNHADLRAELDARGAHAWRGHSDTETLLEGIAAWGFRRALEKAVGMFAIALWDRHERRLHLARDRFGEKPLYYGWVGRDFVFGSELKAIRLHPDFDNPIDRAALRPLAHRAYIPAPLSVFEHIYKLEPGCTLSVAADPLPARPDGPPAEGSAVPGLRVERYWSYKAAVAAGLGDPILDEEEALERLEQTLSAVIRAQSVADVPVGAFLSGGIDSSTVVGLYQKYATGSVRTFSIGFEEEGFNEAEHAKAVARHFGTDHHERYVTSKEAQAVLPLLPSMYDEPFADPSMIPTHLVSRFAREQVKVALSGDAGDELFGGYNRYFGTAWLWSHFSKLPGPARRVLGGTLAQVPPRAWEEAARFLPGGRRPPYFGTKVQKTFRTMSRAASLDDVFNSFLDEWSGDPTPALGGAAASEGAFDLDLGGPAPDAVRMMYCDAVSYLPGDILCKVDRAAMAVSLETRVPFLDHRVAELAARIPIGMKIRGGRGKLILRKLLYREAPAALFERPKSGFGMPVGQWLKGPLRDWAESLLDERRLREEGFFNAAQVRRRWSEHLSGKRDATFALWSILMFGAWHEAFCRADPAEPAAAPARRLAG